MNRVAGQTIHSTVASRSGDWRPSHISQNRTESNKPERLEHVEHLQNCVHPTGRLPFNRPEPGWTRLNKPEQPEHPIPRKTLEIVPDSPAKEKFHRSPEHLLRRVHATHPRLFNRPEPGWTRLNKPEQPEHPIPRKTLEIVPDSTAKEKFRRSPEHRRSRKAHSPGSSLPRSACVLVGTRTRKSGIVKTVASGGVPDCEGRGWLRVRRS